MCGICPFPHEASFRPADAHSPSCQLSISTLSSSQPRVDCMSFQGMAASRLVTSGFLDQEWSRKVDSLNGPWCCPPREGAHCHTLPQTWQETCKTQSPLPGPCPDAHMVEGGKRLQASTYRCDVSTALEQGARYQSRGEKEVRQGRQGSKHGYRNSY